MIKTVQEGIEKYKEKLRAYKAWIDPLVKHYDTLYGKGKWSPISHFGGSDYDKIGRLNTELYAMVEVLGLSKDEEVAIDKECGIKTAEELAAEVA